MENQHLCTNTDDPSGHCRTDNMGLKSKIKKSLGLKLDCTSYMYENQKGYTVLGYQPAIILKF